MSLLYLTQLMSTVTKTGEVISYGTPPYPPVPVLWMTAAIDTLCIPLQCSQWRSFLFGIDTVYESAPPTAAAADLDNSSSTSAPSWLAYRVPSVMGSYPKLLSYSDFVQQQQQTPLPLHRSLYQYAFQTDNTELGDLLTPTALTACLCLVLALRVCKRQIMPVFSSWAQRAAIATHGSAWMEHNTERIAKFGEYCFRLLYHSFIAAYGIYYFASEPYWVGPGRTNTSSIRYLYDEYPHQTITPQMGWYYLLQSAYNVDALISLAQISFCIRNKNNKTCKYDPSTVILSLPAGGYQWCWSETVRGDFREMAMHHVVTNCLVIGSSICRLTRAGSMVFWVHDVSDVPVDLSKLANFVKKKYTTLACFLTMCVTWMYTRLYILPFVIFEELYFDSERLMHNGLPILIYKCYLHFFLSWMMLLILLHTVWFVMFLRMFATFVQKRECHDLSEHKQGEDHTTTTTTKGKPQQQHTTSTANGTSKKKD